MSPKTGTGWEPEPDDDFDDLPQTHLDDEAYDAFVKGEFDGRGRLAGGPAVGWVVLVLIAIVLALAVILFR